MEQIFIRRLREGTLGSYRAAAKAMGRSLEAELRDLIERNKPAAKDSAALLRLSEEALAMTPPDGPHPSSDSTLLIRWDRDTDHGRDTEDGWDRDAGR